MDLATAHGIEESDFFFAIVTEAYMREGQHRDEITYAKALGKPFALAIEKGIVADWLKSVRDSLLKKRSSSLNG